MEKEPNMLGEDLDKTRREAAAELIKGGADYAITGVTPEQAENLEKEHEGEWVPNVAAWIRLHKEIACPKDTLNKGESKSLENAKGHFWENNNKFYFFDSDGNIASFKPDFSKIGTLQKNPNITNELKMLQLAANEMEKYGFSHIASQSGWVTTAEIAIKRYQDTVERNEKDRVKGEFDF
ncbi:MAG: hypothetical protein PHE24_03830 [Patescibacteria group bacterium]|nr:hypothetical protein [Patescibacteria group bacterium]